MVLVVVLAVVLAVAVVLVRVGSGAATRPPPAVASARPTVVGTVPVGPSPVAVQVAPDGTFAYIADRDARAITVLDTVGGTVTGTIPVPEGGPQTVTFSPDGRQAYVGVVLGTGGEVAVVDTSSGSVTARVATGSAPAAVAVSPDGHHVFASVTDGVLVIDAPTATVVGQFPVAEPHGLAFSPDGRRLAVADFEAGAVIVFDTADGRPLTTVPVGRSPHAVAWDPSRPLVFVGNYAGNSVSVLDVDTGGVVATVPTAVHPQAVTLSADGRYVYVAAIDAHVVQVLDATTFRVTATVPTGRGPSSVAVAPDGRQAWVTDLLDGTVTVLDVAAP